MTDAPNKSLIDQICLVIMTVCALVGIFGLGFLFGKIS